MSAEPLSRWYVEAMEMVECSQKCSKCGAPYHYKKSQGIPFCWECVVNKENVRRGRSLLERLQAQTQGKATDEDELRGPFRFGMPL